MAAGASKKYKIGGKLLPKPEKYARLVAIIFFMTITPSLQSLLTDDNPLSKATRINQWIQNNIHHQEALHEALSVIYQNPKYFHIALTYAEESLRNWNFVHPKMLEAIGHIFTDFAKISGKNGHISDFLHTHGRNFLKNKQILNYVSQIEAEKIHPSLGLRLLEDFQENYQYNILLAEYRPFYQEILKNLGKKYPEYAQKIISTGSEQLFEKFGFSLSEGYELLFEITKTRGKFARASDSEIAHLKRLGSQTLYTALENMDFPTFSGFIDRFADIKGNVNGVNFLGFPNISAFSKQKRFYLSFIYETRIFEPYEEKDFLEFILESTEKRQGEIFGENAFGKSENIFSLLEKMEISIFKNKKLYEKLIIIAGKNEEIIWNMRKYLKKMSEKPVTTKKEEVLDFLRHTRTSHPQLKNDIFSFWVNQLWNFFPLSALIFVEKNIEIWPHINELHDIKQKILRVPIEQWKKQSYRTILVYFSILKNTLNATNSDLS